MEFMDTAREIIRCENVRESGKELLEDTVDALLGNPVSAAKVLVALGKSPFLIREEIFWSKMENYLNGIFLSENDRSKMCAKLAENGKKRENAVRLIECIDNAETEKTIDYLVNVTRCLLTGFVNLNTFFRIAHIVTHTIVEDLEYLREHIDESELPYDECVQGLLTAGLMYQSIIDGGSLDNENEGNGRYSFTPFARKVDQYAVSFQNTNRYPNPVKDYSEDSQIKSKITGVIAQFG